VGGPGRRSGDRLIPAFVVAGKAVVSLDIVVDADTQEEARILVREQPVCEASLHDAIQEGRFERALDGELIQEVDP
jgi:hypothetical protein